MAEISLFGSSIISVSAYGLDAGGSARNYKTEMNNVWCSLTLIIANEQTLVHHLLRLIACAMPELENKHGNPCKIGYGVAGPNEDNHINPYSSKYMSQGGQGDWC